LDESKVSNDRRKYALEKEKEINSKAHSKQFGWND
jgi:hypothetical protein